MLSPIVCRSYQLYLGRVGGTLEHDPNFALSVMRKVICRRHRIKLCFPFCLLVRQGRESLVMGQEWIPVDSQRLLFVKLSMCSLVEPYVVYLSGMI